MFDPIRMLTGLVSPGGQRGRLLTFYFHRVLEQPDPMQPGEMDARLFELTLTWIGQQFQVLHPREACERLQRGDLPARAAVISFDDGYRDNHDVALPILLRHRMSAVFFIATGYMGEGVQFNDRLREAFRVLAAPELDLGWAGLGRLATASLADRLHALGQVRESVKYLEPDARWAAVERIEALCVASGGELPSGRMMMTPQEVRQLEASGMEIGGHTRTHPILLAVDDTSAFADIQSGRDDLAAVLSAPPVLFSYPNGKLGRDFGLQHVEMARRAGFSFGFSTERGVGTCRSDAMMLPRFMPWHGTPLKFKVQALRALGH